MKSFMTAHLIASAMMAQYSPRSFREVIPVKKQLTKEQQELKMARCAAKQKHKAMQRQYSYIEAIRCQPIVNHCGRS